MLGGQLPDLGNLDERSDVVLHCQHAVVQKGLVVLLDGLGSVLGLLVHDGSRAKELAELIAVEPALLEFADLLEESLI